MKIFLVGPNGLVGSAFSRYFEKKNMPFFPIGRGDIQEFSGQDCDLMILCCGSGNKGNAIQNPLIDFSESVENIVYYLHNIKAKKVLLISSVDVYNSPSSFELTREETPIKLGDLHSYGFHKYLAEQYVGKFCENHLIIRLPGLVGPNLKKNAIFDHCHPDKKLFLSPDSHLNFVHTDDVAQKVMGIIEAENLPYILNFAASKNLKIRDLEKITNIPCEFHESAINNTQIYNVNTQLASTYFDLEDSQWAVNKYFTQDL